MWAQTDCIDYLKTASVIAAYVDQSISTNTFYSPKHFADGKVPATLIAKNLMLGIHWGLKTYYYSLIDKQGSKNVLRTEENIIQFQPPVVLEDADDCEACKL
jgi:ribonucleoside-diphosphate reductase alpha chain